MHASPSLAPSPTGVPPTGGLLPSGHELDFSKTGILWLDWLIDIITVAIFVSGLLLPLYITKVRPHLKVLMGDVERIREQTENSHANAPHPNLRDNIDANQNELRAAHSAVLQRLDQLGEAIVEQRKDIGGIRSELRADREEARRVREALDEHISEKRDVMPRLAEVERELRTHRRNTETQ